ncbi:MAG: cation transporter [Planctomycetes bacterium]|nr:cation transporter [Planctomycetota bacterium]
MSVQLVALLANVALAVLKFTVGHAAGSRALVADGFNSAGDVLATFVAWLAFRYARRAPDADHPYGHANAEALAGLLIAGMLLATGGFIAIDGIDTELSSGPTAAPPGALALAAAAITMAIKTALWLVSRRVGLRTNSPTLLASARDHVSDVVIGAAAFTGIALSRSGVPALDGICAIAIGAWIVVLGIKPLRENVGILMHQAPVGHADRARAIGRRIAGAIDVAEVRVQPLGGQYRIDLVLLVDGSLSVVAAHTIAHEVESAIRAELEHVHEVYVHVEPGTAVR